MCILGDGSLYRWAGTLLGLAGKDRKSFGQEQAVALGGISASAFISIPPPDGKCLDEAIIPCPPMASGVQCSTDTVLRVPGMVETICISTG